MSLAEKGTDSVVKLLPHQATLLDTFFDPTSKRVFLLRSDVGLGKTTALIAIIRRLQEERPGARALCLVPASLRLQYVDMLRNAGAPSMLVDRYRFREMLDSTLADEFWPRGVTAILSRDFAHQRDVLDKLVETRWDLVVADEGHWFRGVRGKTLQRLVASAERVVLATATAPDFEWPDGVLTDDLTVVEWRRDSIVGHDGRPLYTLPRPLLHEVGFKLSPAELSLSDTVGALCRIFETRGHQQGWIARSLRRSLESSPAAVERALQRIAEGLSYSLYDYEIEEIQEDELDGRADQFTEEIEGNELEGRVDVITDGKAIQMTTEALQTIEGISIDSKLSALSELLAQVTEHYSVRVFVFTDYLATLYYLAAEIEGRGISCQVLRGAVSTEEQEKTLTLFRENGPMLLGTRAVMTENINLSNVTDIVLYDLPDGERMIREILGQFDRFGRISQLSIHVLQPLNGTNQFLDRADQFLAFLRNLFEPDANEKEQGLSS
jgi:superfamily II DNA or RNA helicase